MTGLGVPLVPVFLVSCFPAFVRLPRHVPPDRAVLLLIAASTALRLVPAATTGLGIDESYMVGNARTWTLSTVDHPPLHVWLVAAVRALGGTESAFVLRLPFLLLGAGSTWQLHRLASDLLGPRAGPWSALLFGLAPVFTISTAGWILPDGPLVFFLLAAARCLDSMQSASSYIDSTKPGPSVR